MERRSVRAWLFYLTLGLCAVLPYLNALTVPFLWDDKDTILANTFLHDLRNAPALVGSIFRPAYFVRADEYYWRPLVTLSYMVDWATGGGAPWTFHVTNVAAHLCATLLFGGIARTLMRPAPAWIAAAVFAVHPIHAETVTWINGRSDGLCGLFAFAAALSFFIARRHRRWWPWSPAAAALFGGALLAKEMALPLPVLLLLWECWTRRDRPGQTRREIAGTHAALWAVLGLYCALRFGYLHPPPIPGLTLLGGTHERALLSSANIAEGYLLRLVWPATLSIYYNLTVVTSPAHALFVRAVLCLASVTLAAWAVRRRAPMVFAGWVAFLVLLAPVMNLVPLTDPEADRFLYLPSAGICLAVGALLGCLLDACRPRPGLRRMTQGLIAALVLVLSARLAVRNGDFQSERRLFASAARIGDRHPHARYNLGLAALNGGEFAMAEREFRMAVQLDPEYVDALGSLAEALQAQGRAPEGLPFMERAVRLAPEAWQGQVNYGVLLAQTGAPERAATAFAAAAALAPPSAAARTRYLWVRTLQHLGRWDAARRACALPFAQPPTDRDQLARLRQACAAGPRPKAE